MGDEVTRRGHTFVDLVESGIHQIDSVLSDQNGVKPVSLLSSVRWWGSFVEYALLDDAVLHQTELRIRYHEKILERIFMSDDGERE